MRLGRLLGPIDLAWVLDDDAIVISTPERADNELILVVYPVRDLVAVKIKSGSAATYQKENYQQLVDLITATIAPTTWSEGNGPASLFEEPASGTIVFTQTRAVQAQVEQLLAALRQARAAQGLRPGEVEVAPPRWMQCNATGQPGGGFYAHIHRPRVGGDSDRRLP